MLSICHRKTKYMYTYMCKDKMWYSGNLCWRQLGDWGIDFIHFKEFYIIASLTESKINKCYKCLQYIGKWLVNCGQHKKQISWRGLSSPISTIRSVTQRQLLQPGPSSMVLPILSAEKCHQIAYLHLSPREKEIYTLPKLHLGNRRGRRKD